MTYAAAEKPLKYFCEREMLLMRNAALSYCSGCLTSQSCGLLDKRVLFAEIWDWRLKCTVLKRRRGTFFAQAGQSFSVHELLITGFEVYHCER